MARQDFPAFSNPYIDTKQGDGWLVNVLTSANHRQKGHAVHLIREVASAAEIRKARGKLPDFNGFHLYTEAENVSFYQKLGFEMVGRECISYETDETFRRETKTANQLTE
jgi:ribosomal protein S18 acetylase RimI-like enzyme